MPKPSVPAVIPPKARIVLDDKLKTGYNFFRDRWDGEDNEVFAKCVSAYWRQHGWGSEVFTDYEKSWRGGKNVEIPYFKVWLRHPEDKSLYAWWSPTATEWTDEPKMEELTWFEFVVPDKDAKK